MALGPGGRARWRGGRDGCRGHPAGRPSAAESPATGAGASRTGSPGRHANRASGAPPPRRAGGRTRIGSAAGECTTRGSVAVAVASAGRDADTSTATRALTRASSGARSGARSGASDCRRTASTTAAGSSRGRPARRANRFRGRTGRYRRVGAERTPPGRPPVVRCLLRGRYKDDHRDQQRHVQTGGCAASRSAPWAWLIPARAET